ncbi:EscV/YscV/HrcV family type III secretion system export apparatus protein [Pararobbsia silviterrae]|uniref:EscV/YscV/HrcV family type III secretion system export apparatus protein n=1 Tax=Pararobbsia silviterrae TaxID=1792498 RepID=UPI003B831346
MGARQDLFMVALIVAIIAMLIVPLPTVLVDSLIAANIVLALLIFISTLYVKSVLEFSSFPAILLVTTLFRLSLSISTTRLILLQGDAGQIITTFGEFVVGDSLVVGLVIFAIVTIVQFIVITKGAERIAEVVARFSLDAMPGKQMSIDGDARAGTLSTEQVESARRRIEKESQLHGAFDGALKFVKGDAIAGMIIICVNLIGGIAAGTLAHGMTLSDAVATYSLLSIGDGLVAQIPALLISVGAGFIVTRVAGDERNLGQQMMTELVSQPPVLLICAGLSFAIGLLPGFPFVAFALLGAVLAGLYTYRRVIRGEGGAASTAAKPAHDRATSSGAAVDTSQVGDLVPIIVELPADAGAMPHASDFEARLTRAVRLELGIRLPRMRVDTVASSRPHHVAVRFHETPAATFGIAFDRAWVPDFDDDPHGLELDCVALHDLDPSGVSDAAPDWWVALADRERMQHLGYSTLEAIAVLEDRFVRLVARSVQELFGVQETKHVLDEVERTHPELLKETYRHVPLIRLTEIFQRLIAERVSIRNARLVLEAIALWAPREKDVLVLTEHVRAALARSISERFLNTPMHASVNVPANVSATALARRVILVAPESEERVRAGIRQVAAGAFLHMAPEESDAFVEAVAQRLDALRVGRASSAVLMCAVDIRRFVKKLVERRFPDLDVMSFAEVSDCVHVDIAGSV